MKWLRRLLRGRVDSSIDPVRLRVIQSPEAMRALEVRRAQVTYQPENPLHVDRVVRKGGAQ